MCSLLGPHAHASLSCSFPATLPLRDFVLFNLRLSSVFPGEVQLESVSRRMSQQREARRSEVNSVARNKLVATNLPK